MKYRTFRRVESFSESFFPRYITYSTEITRIACGWGSEAADVKLAMRKASRSEEEGRGGGGGSIGDLGRAGESFKRAEWSTFRGPSESRSHGRPNCIQTLPIKLAFLRLASCIRSKARERGGARVRFVFALARSPVARTRSRSRGPAAPISPYVLLPPFSFPSSSSRCE